MNNERKEEGAPFLFLVHRGWRFAPVLPETEKCAVNQAEGPDRDRRMGMLSRIPSGGESGVCGPLLPRGKGNFYAKSNFPAG